MSSKNILITGGAGFIGSHVVRRWVKHHPENRVVNVDKLTYAGNLANLQDVESSENYLFVRADICDFDAMRDIFARYAIEGVIHLAAESHVDRSIADPFAFARTNILGTLSLLQAAKLAWAGDCADKVFYHVSTDEVYGALEDNKTLFTETTRYDPHSPYSASKASSDHFVRAFHDTYGLPVKISNCSNNYGPYQFPEKLIPLFINNIIQEKPLPVYGQGENVRDWLYVEDHAQAIDLIFHEGRVGETYNIGGCNEWRNIDLIRLLVRVTDELLGRPVGTSEHLITHVTDRAGHDFRYAIDSSKLRRELAWEPSLQFEEGIRRTVRWYLDNPVWLNQITSGEYQNYYAKMYEKR
jgi:dTDP-glucose 4,6-dehydratase